jgi:hypothetical protein
VKFVATKKGLTTNFFVLFLDPGSGIRDPESGMGKTQDPGSGINIPDPQHCCDAHLSLVEDAGDLEEFIRGNLVQAGPGWQCLICGFCTKYKHRAWEHVEVILSCLVHSSVPDPGSGAF